MRALLTACLVLTPAAAQTPSPGSKAFFLQDPKAVITGCIKEIASLAREDGELESMVGMGQLHLAAGNWRQAEDRFDRAEALLTTSQGRIFQLIGSGRLRSGDTQEARIYFDKLLGWKLKDSDPYFGAAKDLLRAGFEKEAGVCMERAWLLKMSDWKAMLGFAQVAASAGRKGLAADWCQRALDAVPREARVWSLAARILADAEATKEISLAPWAALPRPEVQGAPRTIWVVGSFVPVSPWGAAGIPDSDPFVREVTSQITEAVPGAKLLPGFRTVDDLGPQQDLVASRTGPNDLILGIERFEVSDEERSRYAQSFKYRILRLRIACYDRTGRRLRSHSFHAMTGWSSTTEALAAVRDAMATFLRDPAFPRWLD